MPKFDLLNSATAETPRPSSKWLKMDEKQRTTLIKSFLGKYPSFSNIEVSHAPDNGQIVLRIERQISASERGLFLLDLEEKIKAEIDKGLSIWCEPVGDKSKLRQLRGVEIKVS